MALTAKDSNFEEFKWAHITLEVSIPHKSREIIYEAIYNLLQNGGIQFTQQLHITLDYIGRSIDIHAINKLNSIKSLNMNMLAQQVKTISLWKINSFVSDRDSQRVFYIEVLWGEQFFDALRTQWYNITTPHVTIFTCRNLYSDREVNEILKRLNSNQRVIDALATARVDKSSVALKARGQTEMNKHEIKELLTFM